MAHHIPVPNGKALHRRITASSDERWAMRTTKISPNCFCTRGPTLEAAVGIGWPGEPGATAFDPPVLA